MSNKRVKKYVELDVQYVAWVEDTYPRAVLSDVLNLLLEEFKNAHHVSPADLAAIGAKALKERLEER